MDKKITGIKYIEGEPLETSEVLAGEEALQIKINGRAYTITMRTPGQDRMLAVGLLFTEGVVTTNNDIVEISETPAPEEHHTLIVDVGIKEKALEGKRLFNRAIASSASCGVCGKIELCDLVAPQHVIGAREKLDMRIIPYLLEKMQAQQTTFDRTGGSHAAAAFRMNGDLLSAKEDIGRHNAVDKVIGDLLLRSFLPHADILFISGRVSYEIAAKCAQASIPFLLAVSAPSSLAVDFCARCGITLIGFCRENRATVYTHGKNILKHVSRGQTPITKSTQ